jgi:hypothetical protein
LPHEKLLTDLQIRHYSGVKALKTDAGRVFAVHKHNPEHTREYLLLLDKYNRKGIAVNSEQHLACCCWVSQSTLGKSK